MRCKLGKSVDLNGADLGCRSGRRPCCRGGARGLPGRAPAAASSLDCGPTRRRRGGATARTGGGGTHSMPGRPAQRRRGGEGIRPWESRSPPAGIHPLPPGSGPRRASGVEPPLPWGPALGGPPPPWHRSSGERSGAEGARRSGRQCSAIRRPRGPN